MLIKPQDKKEQVRAFFSRYWIKTGRHIHDEMYRRQEVSPTVEGQEDRSVHQLVQVPWSNETYLSMEEWHPDLLNVRLQSLFMAPSAHSDQCCPALLEPRTPLYLISLTPEVQTKRRSKAPSLTRSDISDLCAVTPVADPLRYELQYSRLHDTCTAALHVSRPLLPLLIIPTVLAADRHVGRNMLQDNEIHVCALCWLQWPSTFS